MELPAEFDVGVEGNSQFHEILSWLGGKRKTPLGEGRKESPKNHLSQPIIHKNLEHHSI